MMIIPATTEVGSVAIDRRMEYSFRVKTYPFSCVIFPPGEVVDIAVVLIVENDENQAELLRRELAEEGHTVWLARGGREALSIVRETLPEVVVLDLQMPDMHGLDALTAMLAVQSNLPVIIYTGYGSYSNSFISRAADTYLVKSSDLRPLTDEVRRLVKRQEQEYTEAAPAEKRANRQRYAQPEACA